MSSRARFRRKLRSGYSHPKSAESHSSSQMTLVDLSDISVKCSTPYRLPRISPPGTDSPVTMASMEPPPTTISGDDTVFGRFGYEECVRMPELGPSITKALINPHSNLAQRYRQAGLAVPRFKTAAITPTYRHHRDDRHTPRTPYIPDGNDDLLDEYDSHTYLKSDMTNPSTTPISRGHSPAKSAKSIHWALGNERNALFDTSGRSRAQGPFSREFTIRCQPPPNWMRMKWGRSKTTMASVH